MVLTWFVLFISPSLFIVNACMFGSLIDTVFWTASVMCDLLPYDGYVLHTTPHRGIPRIFEFWVL